MARKRKADKTFNQPANVKAAKYDIEETFNDSQDEFYAGQDKILLNEDVNSKRRRRLAEQEKDLQPSDEEVLDYQDTDVEEEDVDDEGDDDEADYQDLSVRSKKTRQNQDEDEDDEGSEEENWGTSKADYFNADLIETEADALEEENEAKRLYQKQLKNMTEADFGFDEDAWIEQKKETKGGRFVTEKLPEARIPANASELQKLDILRTRYPELQPLAEDFERLQKVKDELDEEVDLVQKRKSEGLGFTIGLPVSVKRNALAAYLATISMYFAIVSSTATEGTGHQSITAMPPIELHEHPIIQSLTKARQFWDQVEDLEVAEPIQSNSAPVSTSRSKDPLEIGDPQDGAEEEEVPIKKPVQTKRRTKEELQNTSSKKSKTLEVDSTSTKKKKSKSKSTGKFNDAELQALISITNKTAPSASDDSDIGEEQPLTATEAAEKQRKRKSLRFYTSQIASKANKRGHASREAGGDDDLPYKERTRDRVERLNREAAARGRNLDNTDLDDNNDPNTTTRRSQSPDPTTTTDVNDTYYTTLLAAQSQKRATKLSKSLAHAEAAAQGAGATVYEQETIGPDGKRAITYAIAKNKGLTPKRKKEVRNPRVKKRMKYDEKMKKLGSVRQVYKGGEGKGGYKGELTGIKTNVVKSIKL